MPTPLKNVSSSVGMLFHSQYPIGSMYAIYGNIYHQDTPNVSIYTIHGSYGIGHEYFSCVASVCLISSKSWRPNLVESDENPWLAACCFVPGNLPSHCSLSYYIYIYQDIYIYISGYIYIYITILPPKNHPYIISHDITLYVLLYHQYHQYTTNK